MEVLSHRWRDGYPHAHPDPRPRRNRYPHRHTIIDEFPDECRYGIRDDQLGRQRVWDALLDTSQFHGGSRPVKITGRTSAWNGIGQNVTVSVWVRSQSGTPTGRATLRLTASTTTYVTLASATINSTGWTQLTGTVPVSWSGTLTGMLFYVETAAGTDNIYIDNASLRR